MTTSATPNAPKADRVETFLDWFRVNTKLVVAGAAVIAAAAGIYWFVGQNARNKAATAEQRLQIGRQAVIQGNAALAQTDLQQVVDRYADTPSGPQAAMLLAQVHYDRGEYQKGIDVLRKAVDGAEEGSVAALHGLMGDGLVMLNKHDEAAQSFERAAETARLDGTRAMMRANRARALMAAGKTEEAKQAWTELANDPTASSVAGEARVRLGELNAKAATRG